MNIKGIRKGPEITRKSTFILSLMTSQLVFPSSASAKSLDDIAKELSNPVSQISTLESNLDYLWFDGDLQDADEQTAFRYSVEPKLSYPQSDGNNLIIKPKVPLLFREPVNRTTGFKDEKVELGDAGFEALYGGANPDSGLLLGLGIAATLPTATDERLAGDQLRLGPEILLGVEQDWGVAGTILSHQYDVIGEDYDYSVTSINYFYAVSLGQGWQIAADHSASYDYEASNNQQWTIPVGIGIHKTTTLGQRPFKWGIELYHYVETPDAFAPDWQIRFNLIPVIRSSYL